jgi:hypothetical protein
MPMQINVGDHVSAMPTYQPVPLGLRAMVRWARTRANAIARNRPAADVYFRRLPGGRSLTQLLADNATWINYSPALNALPAYGQTDAVGGKEIAIGPQAFRVGRWTVLATLIHELAHSNGAPGGTDRSAEEAVLACGLGNPSERSSGVDDGWTPYAPGIQG